MGIEADGVRPVLVIGNGPVGQTTALLLARWGLRVVLLDQRAERDPTGSKSICQQADVLDVWDSIGAGQRIAAEGVTWTTARTFYRDRELFAYTMDSGAAASFPPFVNISQARTESILDELITEQPKIDVRWGHEVVRIDQGREGVVLHCRTSAGETELRGSWAVACAGAHGDVVRAELGVRFEGHSFQDRFLICDIRADLPGWVRERRFHFDPSWNPGRQVLIHPCPGSTFRIDWQVPPDFDLDAERESGALDRRIRQIIGDRRFELLWSTVYRFQSRCADRMRVGRVLLAGDCAHLVAPFGARGLNSGVQDAENAAWKIAYVEHGWADESLVESYHVERRAAALENVEVVATTMRFLVPGNDIERAHRSRVLERAVRDADMRSEVNSGRLAEPFWYVDSPLTTPDPSRPFAGRPPRGTTPPPGPGILVPDVRTDAPQCTRLRVLAREGFVLLVCAGARRAEVDAAVARFAGVAITVCALVDVDPSGQLAELLNSRPAEVWLLRPDAHVAAVLTDPTRSEVDAALRRCLLSPPEVRTGARAARFASPS